MALRSPQFHYWDPRGDLDYQKAELPRFVRHDDPAVEAILRRRPRIERILAAQCHALGTALRFLGPCADRTPAGVDAEVRSVFDYFSLVHRPILAYLENNHEDTLERQAIRSPTCINRVHRGGNCIDLACLMAALLYRLDHWPIIVVIERLVANYPQEEWQPCHAVLGYWRRQPRMRTGAGLAAEELRFFCDADQVRFVETLHFTAPNRRRPVRKPSHRAMLKWAGITGGVGGHEMSLRVGYAVDIRAAYLLDPGLRPYGAEPGRPATLSETAALLSNHGDTRVAKRVRRLNPDLLSMQDLRSEVRRIVLELLEPLARTNGWAGADFFPGALDDLESNRSIPEPLVTGLHTALSSTITAKDTILRVLGDLALWWVREVRALCQAPSPDGEVAKALRSLTS